MPATIMFFTTAPPRGVAAHLLLLALSIFASSCGGGKDTTSVRAGPPASLTIVSGDQQQATVGTELSNPVVVKVVDANGNAIQGQTVNFRITAGGGSVFAGVSTTNSDGIAQERWTLGTVAGQDQTLEARAVDNSTGQALVFATFHATAVAGPATKLAIVTQPSAAAQSGRTLDTVPVVRLADQYGNAVSQKGLQVTAVLPNDNSGRTLSGGGTASTDATGIATFTGLTITGPIGSVSLTFTAGSLTSVTSNPITLGAGAPTQLKASGPTTFSGTVGTALATLPKVVVLDAAGNPVQGVSVQFAISNGGGTIAPTSVATDANGTAGLTSWTLGTTAGTYMVTASASAIAGATVTFTATAQAGVAAQLAIVSGDHGSGAVRTAVPPLVVKVTDAHGNPVSAAAVSWAIASGGGTLSSATSTTDSTGETSVALTLPNAAGTVQVTASIGAAATVTFTLTATAGAAASLTKVAGDAQTATVGTAVPIVPSVRVTDANGNPVSGVTVTFAVTSGGGSLTNGGATTNANGTAAVGSWTLGTVAGQNALNASVSGAAPVVFSATAVAGVATKLVIGQQPSATAQSGIALSQQPRIQLADQYGNPTTGAGISITAAATISGVTLTNNAVPTTASGVATFTALSVTGSDTVFALVFSGPNLSSTTSNSVRLIGSTSHTWVGGDQGGPQNWSDANNWSPAGVPSQIDSAFIPAVASNVQPILTADVEIRSAAVAPGATIDLRNHTLTVDRVLSADGAIVNGTVRLASTATSLRGNVPALWIDNSVVTLSGSTTASNTTVTGKLTVLAESLTVNGTLLVQGATAYLAMQHQLGRVIVMGDATFDGGDSSNQLGAGTLELHGSIIQRSDFSQRSFAPIAVKALLAGTGTERIDFATPSSRQGTGSYFAFLFVATPVAVVSASPIYVSSQVANLSQDVFTAVAGSDLSGVPALYCSGGLFPKILGASPQALYLENAGVYGAISYAGSVTVTGSAPSSLEGLHFGSDASGAGQLTIQGDLTLAGPGAYLTMGDPGARLLVGGNFVFDGGRMPNYEPTAMAAGTLELKGDFTQRASYSGGNFEPAASFVTLFSGSRTQNVSFATPGGDTLTSRFGALTSGNSSGGLSLLSDVFVSGAFTTTTSAGVSSSHRLAVAGPVTTSSGSALAIPVLEIWGTTGGSLVFGGTLPGELLISGSMTLGNDLDFQAPVTVTGLLNVANHSMTVSTLTVTGIGAFLQMADPAGHLIVLNDAKFAGGINGGQSPPLTAGTFELKGNLTIVSSWNGTEGNAAGGFEPRSAHVMLFSGTAPQVVQYVPDHIVVDPPAVEFANLTGGSGSNVTLNWNAVALGATNLFGNLTVPSGTTLSVNTLHLYSSSNTVVQGSLVKSGACTADPGATYTGFTCP